MNRRNLFLFGYLFIVSCGQTPPLSGTLNFTTEEAWQPNVYLIQPRTLDEVGSNFMGVVLDSAIIDDEGAFSFKKMPQTTDPILLQIVVQKQEERYLNKLENEDLLHANYFPIVWATGQKLEIAATIHQFQNSFTIKNPSAQNAALLELSAIRQSAYQQFLAKENSNDNHGVAIIDQADALHNFRKPLIEFAKTAEYLLPAMVALRWVSPINDYERVPEFLVNQCEKWQVTMADHPWVTQLCQKGNRTQLPVLIGDKIPNFQIPMSSGDTIPLYQQFGERLTLLDLWASWCGPCRLENKEFLVPLWDQYHKAGFQIVGYALDSNQKVWERAIQKDGAHRWPNASHLRGDDAPLMEALRLQTIPANILLDTQGKILAKNLHGEELVEYIRAYFK